MKREEIPMGQLSKPEIEKACTEEIARDDEYVLYTNPERTYFYAGCVKLSRKAALEHWRSNLRDCEYYTIRYKRAEKFSDAILKHPVIVDPIKEMQRKIMEMQDNLAKLEKEEADKRKAEEAKKKGPFKPKEGETYYCIESGCVEDYTYLNHAAHRGDVQLGNCFRTKEEATAHKDRQIALCEVNEIIREVNGDWEPDWSNGNQIKYKLAYTRERRELRYDYNKTHDAVSELIPFPKCNLDTIINKVTQDQINKIWRL